MKICIQSCVCSACLHFQVCCFVGGGLSISTLPQGELNCAAAVVHVCNMLIISAVHFLPSISFGWLFVCFDYQDS